MARGRLTAPGAGYSRAVTATTAQVRDVAERVESSEAAEHLGRLGLAARTVVWFVLGVLVVQLALGRASGSTDQSGALKALAATPLGAVLLVVLALGFLVWAGHRFLCAAVGKRDKPSRLKRWLSRGKTAGEGVLYLVATATAVRVLFGVRVDSEEETDSATAAVMALPGGRTLVGVLGLAVVGIGLVLVVRALRRTHSDRLEHFRVPPRLRRPAVTVGVVGLIGRAAVVTLIGGFLVHAALQFDADEAQGLDGALRTVAEQPGGRMLLALTAVGVLAYALWSAIETVWRDL